MPGQIVFQNDTIYETVYATLFYAISNSTDKLALSKGRSGERPRTGTVYVRWSGDFRLPDPNGSDDDKPITVVDEQIDDFDFTFSRHPESSWP